MPVYPVCVVSFEEKYHIMDLLTSYTIFTAKYFVDLTILLIFECLFEISFVRVQHIHVYHIAMAADSKNNDTD